MVVLFWSSQYFSVGYLSVCLCPRKAYLRRKVYKIRCAQLQSSLFFTEYKLNKSIVKLSATEKATFHLIYFRENLPTTVEIFLHKYKHNQNGRTASYANIRTRLELRALLSDWLSCLALVSGRLAWSNFLSLFLFAFFPLLNSSRLSDYPGVSLIQTESGSIYLSLILILNDEINFAIMFLVHSIIWANIPRLVNQSKLRNCNIPWLVFNKILLYVLQSGGGAVFFQLSFEFPLLQEIILRRLHERYYYEKRFTLESRIWEKKYFYHSCSKRFVEYLENLNQAEWELLSARVSKNSLLPWPQDHE